MTIFNLGSINIDHFYRLPRLPAAGETLAAESYEVTLGGKGANQSVAVARAGAEVRHIGMVGIDGGWMVDRMSALGVNTTHIGTCETPTGHAVIQVDPAGENAITLFAGANLRQDIASIRGALGHAGPGDWLMLQNETSHQLEAAKIARARGLAVVYSAAPFAAEAVRSLMPHLSMLILNAVEARQLRDALGLATAGLPVPQTIVTGGAHGVDWYGEGGAHVHVAAPRVRAIDTTGAGDCLAGYAVAELSQGLSPEVALTLATQAAALSVQRKGTAEAIPKRSEVLAAY